LSSPSLTCSVVFLSCPHIRDASYEYAIRLCLEPIPDGISNRLVQANTVLVTRGKQQMCLYVEVRWLTGVGYGLTQERLEYPVQFRWGKVVDDYFSPASPLKNRDLCS